MNKGICKLCLQEKELCKKSHILPKFMYVDFKGSIVTIDGSKHKQKNKGVFMENEVTYEGDILCQDCDNRRLGGELEKYVDSVYYKEDTMESLLPIIYPNGKNEIVVKNFDYKKYKLFLLSLLWRMSISTRPGFNNFSLGKVDEENLRRMIYENDPGEEDIYPILVYTYLTTDIKPGFLNVKIIPSEGIPRIVRLTIGGMIYSYIISPPYNSLVLKYTLKKSNEFTLISLDKISIGTYILKELEPMMEEITEYRNKVIMKNTEN